jgi:hypothetical protein
MFLGTICFLTLDLIVFAVVLELVEVVEEAEL